MHPRSSTNHFERGRLIRPLESDAPLVVLCGPVGSGRTSALAAWAKGRTDVVWLHGPDVVGLPDVSAGFLVIDDADALTGRTWESIGVAMRRHPELHLRISVHSVAAVPAEWDFELVRDLSFNRAELAEYMSVSGSAADPNLVWLLTGGLPAAVRTVLRAAASSEEQIVGALAAEREVGLPTATEILALPHHLTERVVAELGGPADFLEQAERAGWGEWDLDPANRVFTLTAPRRLAAAARLNVPSGLERALRARAATLFLEDGMSHAALVEAAAAGDLGLVDAAIKQGGMPLLTRHGYEINKRLAKLSSLRLHKYPVIALARALVLNARRTSRLKAIELFGIAVVGARAHPRQAGNRALMGVVESVGARLVGLGDGGLKSARRAAQTMEEMSEEERESLRNLEPDLHVHAAVSMFYGGDFAGAGREFERAMSDAARPGVNLQALGGLAFIEALNGDLPTARYWSDLALARHWDEDHLDGYPGSLLRIARAAVAVEALDFEGARCWLEPLWEIVDTIEHWPLLLGTRALIDLATDKAEEGLEMFRRIRRHRSSRRGSTVAMERRLDSTESMLMLATGDMVGARALTAQRGDPVLRQLTVAQVLMLDGLDEKALETLRRIKAVTPRHRFARAVMQAVLLNRAGHTAQADDRVTQARMLHETYGLRSALLLIPAEEREVFGDLAAQVPTLVGSGSQVPRLTPREQVVLAELVRTENLEESATRLQVSVNTVKTQRRSLYRKLDAGSREEALAAALTHGLLD